MPRSIVTELLVPRERLLTESEIWRIARAVHRLQRPRAGAVLAAAGGILLCGLVWLSVLVGGGCGNVCREGVSVAFLAGRSGSAT
jgi:hypothetical protein